MVILIRKRTVLRVLAISLLFSGCAFLQCREIRPVLYPFAERTSSCVTVVIDPGHGGEDGGAVSADGVSESQINLDISFQLNDLLRFSGFRTLMTREQDVSIGDNRLNTIHRRKASDLHRRVEIIDQTPNAHLLSIHQNSLPTSPETHGAQVFWNRQNNAEDMAAMLQASLNSAINIENKKQSRMIPDSIYLMKHISVPGVLIECGFLSNASEASMLQESGYQVKIAAAIASGYLRYTAGEDQS